MGELGNYELYRHLVPRDRTPLDGDEYQFVPGDQRYAVFQDPDVVPGSTWGPVTGSVG